MLTAINIFSGLFLLLAAALVFTWWRSRHTGALLLAVTYLLAAGLALWTAAWWPLLLGFLSAWALRLMGFEPGNKPGIKPGSAGPPAP